METRVLLFISIISSMSFRVQLEKKTKTRRYLSSGVWSQGEALSRDWRLHQQVPAVPCEQTPRSEHTGIHFPKTQQNTQKWPNEQWSERKALASVNWECTEVWVERDEAERESSKQNTNSSAVMNVQWRLIPAYAELYGAASPKAAFSLCQLWGAGSKSASVHGSISSHKGVGTACLNPIYIVTPFLCLLLRLLKGKGSISSVLNCTCICASLAKLYLLTSYSSTAAIASIPV